MYMYMYRLLYPLTGERLAKSEFHARQTVFP